MFTQSPTDDEKVYPMLQLAQEEPLEQVAHLAAQALQLPLTLIK